MNNIKEEMKLLKKTTKDLLHNKFKEIEDFKKCLCSEVEIKDIILQRHIKYSNVLKRELALSKNEANIRLNYNRLDLYSFTNRGPEISLLSNNKTKEARSPRPVLRLPIQMAPAKPKLKIASLSPISRNQENLNHSLKQELSSVSAFNSKTARVKFNANGVFGNATFRREQLSEN